MFTEPAGYIWESLNWTAAYEGQGNECEERKHLWFLNTAPNKNCKEWRCRPIVVHFLSWHCIYSENELTSKCYQGSHLEDDVWVGLLSAEGCWNSVLQPVGVRRLLYYQVFFLNKRMFWALREVSVGKSTVTLVEDHGSVPAPTWYLEAACNSSSMGSHDFLWPLRTTEQWKRKWTIAWPSPTSPRQSSFNLHFSNVEHVKEIFIRHLYFFSCSL